MAEASVVLTVKDQATAQVRTLARELANVSSIVKQMGGTADAKGLAQAASQLHGVADNFGQAERQGKKASESVNAFADSLKGLRGAAGAVAGGGGLGHLFALSGLGGMTAFLGTAAALVAQSIKLAIEFNNVSSMSVLRMTSNAGQIASNLKAFKATAGGMADIGIDATDAARMMGTYAMASGAAPASVLSNARAIGTWATIKGLDREQFAQQSGMIAQYAGPNIDRTSGQIFGAAANMGDYGRRIPELLGTVTSLMTKMESTSPDKQVSVRDALREIVGVTSLGGNFATATGAALTMSGFDKLGENIGGSPAAIGIGTRAGVNLEGLITGTESAADKGKIARELYKELGSGPMLEYTLMHTFGESGGEARHVNEVLRRKRGGFLASDSQLPTEDNTAAKEAYQKSTAGQKDITMATLNNTMTSVGEKILDRFTPDVKKIADGIAKVVGMGLDGKFDDAIGKLDAISNILAITLLIQKGLSGLMKGAGIAEKLFNFLKGAGSTATEAEVVEAVEGAGAVAAAPEVAAVAIPVVLGAAAIGTIFAGAGMMKNAMSKQYDASPAGKMDEQVRLMAWRAWETGGRVPGQQDWNAGADDPNAPQGAYQFMPDTLMGNAKTGAEGWAQKLDPALFAKLGRVGFEKYFRAHPEMQNRYATAYHGAIRDPGDLGAYVEGGSGGLDAHREGRDTGIKRDKSGKIIESTELSANGYAAIVYALEKSLHRGDPAFRSGALHPALSSDPGTADRQRARYAAEDAAAAAKEDAYTSSGVQQLRGGVKAIVTTHVKLVKDKTAPKHKLAGHTNGRGHAYDTSQDSGGWGK